jgi:endonuclease-3
MNKAERSRMVVELLAQEYPEAQCELDYSTPWQLLVATVLSAQCTDQRVNQVTPGLFERWPDPIDLASAPIDDIEDAIRPTGFFRNKARSLKGGAHMIVTEHGGEVPTDLGELIALPGVGRKTAKVVLGEAFGIPAGIAVDTHVRRLSRRIGLTRLNDAEKIADNLEQTIPKGEWITFSLRLILHGRRVCSARRPKCEECVLAPACRQVGVPRAF